MTSAPLVQGSIRIGSLMLPNRLVGTAHASGAVRDGVPTPGDADYWRRLAAGGASMLIVGGTLVSRHSAPRSGSITEAWKPEVLPGLAARAEAIRSEGAVAACQLAHLGRETLGAEVWRHPVGPSAIRSPREAVRPRPLTERDIDDVVADFGASGHHAALAGFQVVELHAAHGYLLAQFLSGNSNARDVSDPLDDGVGLIERIRGEILSRSPELTMGIRVSLEGEEEAGLGFADVQRLLPLLSGFDYVNVTAGVRTTYVRDMATATPPVLRHVAELAAVAPVPLLVSQAFRRASEIEQALQAGADLVGVARPLIADPDFPRKVLTEREAEIRPCTSCNEDCRAKDPVTLCSVNPDLGPPGYDGRPAEPLLIRLSASRSRPRVAVVGAGPAGLEAALRLRDLVDLEVFEADDRIGGQLLTAGSAPHRTGWLRLLDFYRHSLEGVRVHLERPIQAPDLDGFHEVIVAVGAAEAMPMGFPDAITADALLREGASALDAAASVLVADDGSNGWPTLSAVETAVAAGCRVDVVSSASGFAGAVPAESRVQLLRRLRGADVAVHTLSALSALAPGAATVRNVLNDAERTIPTDRTVVVGERVSRPWDRFRSCEAHVQVIGDALVPRKVAHALAEGRAAAQAVLARRASGPVEPPGRRGRCGPLPLS